MAFTVLTAEKHTPKIWGKIRWKIYVKTCRFLVRFSVRFSVRFFGEQLFASKSEKFVQNPFCKRDPLKIYPRVNLLRQAGRWPRNLYMLGRLAVLKTLAMGADP